MHAIDANLCAKQVIARCPPHPLRVLQSPPCLPADTLRRQESHTYDTSTPSGAQGGGDGSSTARFLPQQREQDPELSPSFRPPPREPPDPTAGFTFRPAVQLLSWRRSSHLTPGEARDGVGGILPHRARSPPRDYAERPTPRSSLGSAVGGDGGDLTEERRYREGFREGGAGGAQPGGVPDTELASWNPQQGEPDAYRERFELPPPYALDRRRQRERPLTSSGGSGGGGGAGEDREDERRQASARIAWGGLSLEGREARREMFARGAAGAGYERQREPSTGQPLSPKAVDQMEKQLRGGSGSGSVRGPRGSEERRRLGMGRQDPHRHDWDGYYPARMPIPSSPLGTPETRREGGGGGDGALPWETKGSVAGVEGLSAARRGSSSGPPSGIDTPCGTAAASTTRTSLEEGRSLGDSRPAPLSSASGRNWRSPERESRTAFATAERGNPDQEEKGGNRRGSGRGEGGGSALPHPLSPAGGETRTSEEARDRAPGREGENLQGIEVSPRRFDLPPDEGPKPSDESG